LEQMSGRKSILSIDRLYHNNNSFLGFGQDAGDPVKAETTAILTYAEPALLRAGSQRTFTICHRPSHSARCT